ncbi:MAG: hypothetical protein ABR540_04370 [Acidimicrobiales bacterium]
MAPLLWADPAGAETTIDFEAGYAGSFVPGQEVPVRVRVSTDRLLRATPLEMMTLHVSSPRHLRLLPGS